MTKSPAPVLRKIGKLTVDKPMCLWLNYRNAYRKDNDGKFACWDAPESRRMVRAGAKKTVQSDSRVGSVNSHSSVMEPGFLRYRDRTCWSPKGFPLRGNNQGGTTEFSSSLRPYWPQGRFYSPLQPNKLQIIPS